MTTTQLPQMRHSDAYGDWMAQQGVPEVTGFYIGDINEVAVKDWDLVGAQGAIVNLDGTGGTNNGFIVEIPAGKATKPIHHMFEIMVYVTKGRGATSVWVEGQEKNTFEWQAGSVFAIPLNAWYQHFNGSGTEGARFFAVTNAPVMMNMFHNDNFIFNNPFVFEDRVGNPSHFRGEGTMWLGHTGRNVWETNFVPDVVNFKLYEWKERGAGGTNIMFELANNTMAAHISEFPVGTYKKAHRHGPGAHVFILNGQGFSLLWPRGKPEERIKVDWKPGCVVVPPTQWFHQHFNTGPTRARYLALRWGSQRYRLGGFLGGQEEERPDVSEAEGGAQIEYENEDRSIHELFEDDLRKNGAPCGMKRFIPWCTAAA